MATLNIYWVRKIDESCIMSKTWKTKYGSRRVRVEPPTIEEALFAAEGLTAGLEQQIRIAAILMQLPLEQVRTEAQRILGTRHPAHGPTGRSWVVQRKVPRHIRGQRV
jgi:hypothetical protein